MYLAVGSSDVLKAEAAVAISCDASITKGNPGICQPVILVMIHIRQLVPSAAQGDVGGALVQVVNTLFVEYVAGSGIRVHMAGQHQVHIVEVEEGLQAVPQVVCSQADPLRQTEGGINHKLQPFFAFRIHAKQMQIQTDNSMRPSSQDRHELSSHT